MEYGAEESWNDRHAAIRRDRYDPGFLQAECIWQRTAPGTGQRFRRVIMKKLGCFVAVLVLLLGMIPMGSADTAAVKDWNFYLIPDSNTRELTEEEIWDWDYESMWYLINEIFARHGFVFKENGQFDSYFSRQQWYTPNDDTAANKMAYGQMTSLEWRNEHTIKVVRDKMKELKTKNDEGTKNWKSFIPPEGMLAGFSNGRVGNKVNWPVYSAPSANAWRGANGKASMNAGWEYWGAGWDEGWLMVLYETNKGSVRIGYVQPTYNTGIEGSLNFSKIETTVMQSCTLTDDPMRSNSPVTTLKIGEKVTYLATFYGYGAQKAWAYVETIVEEKRARGFVPVNCLDIAYTDEAISEGNNPLGNG